MPVGWSSAGAAVVIVASLALKLMVQNVAVGEDRRVAVQALGKALLSQGYSVTPPGPELPIVRAERAGCKLTARVLDPHGTYRDTELNKLPRGWSVSYAWRRGWYGSLPRLGPLGEYYGAREFARIGRTVSRAPVIMLSLQPGCARPGAAAVDIRVSLQQVTPANRDILT
ncbi:MAG TPA: hypothetical protein VHG29_08250 [Novosphingobium sp.]|nr:hypothetical protein [Novosphingobium sp.]